MAQIESDVDAENSIGKDYGDDYLKWKKWEELEFGKLSKSEAAYFAAEISRTKSPIPLNARVLEIGFGNGSFLEFAKRNGWDVCGTEINEALVEIAEKRGFNVEHSQDLSAFSDNGFDLIVAFDVLEHIPQDLLPDFILEIKRILKGNGFFIARFPNGDSPFGLRFQNGDITHITSIGSGKIRYFAARANMEVIFAGGEAQPLIGSSALHCVHRIVTLPIKKAIDLFVNAVFFPRNPIAFCSSNLTLVYKATKGTHQQL